MKKKIVLIILAIILVLGIAGTIFYFTNNSMKTPKDQFLGSMEQNLKTIAPDKADLDLKNLSYSQNGNFKMKMKLKDKEAYGSEEAKQIIDGISKTEVQYDILKDGQANKAKTTINLKYNDLDFIKFDLLKINDKLGLKIDEIYSKYVSIENKNLKEVASKFDIDSTNIPDKIEVMDIYEFANIDKEDLKHIEDVYKKVIDESIPEEAYIVNDNVTAKIFDKDVKAKEYKIELTREQTKNLLIKSVETIKNDETIINLIINKSEMILKMVRMFENVPELTKNDIVEGLDEIISEIENEEIEALKITNYRSGNLSKIIISYGDGDIYNIDISKDGNEIKINTYSNMNENNTNTFITINQKNKNESHADIVVKINNELADIEESMSYDLKLNDKVDIEDFTDENSFNLNDKTREEIEKTMQELYFNLIFVIPKKAKILGIDLSEMY